MTFILMGLQFFYVHHPRNTKANLAGSRDVIEILQFNFSLIGGTLNNEKFSLFPFPLCPSPFIHPTPQPIPLPSIHPTLRPIRLPSPPLPHPLNLFSFHLPLSMTACCKCQIKQLVERNKYKILKRPISEQPQATFLRI